jgi:lambda family phage tail tape measure protein
MATIEDFILRFKTTGTDSIKQASAGLQALKSDAEQFSQVGGPLSNTINTIVGKLGPMGLVAGVAGGAFVALGLAAIRMADELSDLSDATGISAGSLMSFKDSIIAAGGKSEDFQKIASKLNQSVQEAAGGNEKLQKAFQSLGVYVTDAGGSIRSTEAILGDLTEKFNKGQVSGAQYAAAIDILGKGINKLDLTKLSALANPQLDQDIKRLADYQTQIDTIRARLEKGIITFFGSVAAQANDAFSAIDKYEKKIAAAETRLNEMGKTSRSAMAPGSEPLSGPLGATGLPDWMQRRMTAEEKAFYDQRKRYSEQEELMRSYRSRAQAEVGGFGGPSETQIKAVESSESRIAQSRIEISRAADLKIQAERFAKGMQGANEVMGIEVKSANDIATIRINLAKDIQKAEQQIKSQENISQTQKNSEFAAKRQELEAKATENITKINIKSSEDTAKYRLQLGAKIAAEEMAQAEQNARELAAYYQQVDQARIQAFDQVDSIKQAREELQRRYSLEEGLVTLGDREAANKRELLDLEEQRLKKIQEISRIENLPFADRQEKIKQANEEYAKTEGIIKRRQETEYNATRDFGKGWIKAYNDYRDSSENAFNAAGRLFNSVTNGMEDSIVNFAKTGKFEFKGFMASILEEILRSQVRQMIAGLFGLGGGSKGGLFGGAIIPGFLASGGPAIANQPYIVGEKGPELFVPNNSGTVVPNNMLGGGGGMVTYNINAVDASSFKQLVARDPGFIYAVTEQGRKTIPSTRR